MKIINDNIENKIKYIYKKIFLILKDYINLKEKNFLFSYLFN